MPQCRLPRSTTDFPSTSLPPHLPREHQSQRSNSSTNVTRKQRTSLCNLLKVVVVSHSHKAPPCLQHRNSLLHESPFDSTSYLSQKKQQSQRFRSSPAPLHRNSSGFFFLVMDCLEEAVRFPVALLIKKMRVCVQIQTGQIVLYSIQNIRYKNLFQLAF